MKKTIISIGLVIALLGLIAIGSGIYGLISGDSPTRILSVTFNYFVEDSYHVYPAQDGIYEFFSIGWITIGLLFVYIGLFRMIKSEDLRYGYKAICNFLHNL